MISSLKRYFRLFFITLLLKKEKLILFNHFVSFYCTGAFYKKRYSISEKKQALQLNIHWLLSSQKNSEDGGMGTYYITEGWTSSYPETSGYILTTLNDYVKFSPERKTEIENSIILCADWL